jgi:hypothetical protein
MEAVERSLSDRANCVRERLRRRGLVHAGISMRSSERGKQDPDSTRQQTQENQSHACFDCAHVAALGSGRINFQTASSSVILAGPNCSDTALLLTKCWLTIIVQRLIGIWASGFGLRLYGCFGLSPHSTSVDSGFDIRRHTSSPGFSAANGFNSLLKRQGTVAMASVLR